jgi:hypothetical protein
MIGDAGASDRSREQSMRRQSTYPMSALFLMVTIVAVFAAIVGTGGPEWLKSLSLPLVGLATFNGFLGPVLMVYQTRRIDMLMLSFSVGTAASFVALRMILGPAGLPVAILGSGVLVAYAIVIRILQPRPQRDTPAGEANGGGARQH